MNSFAFHHNTPYKGFPINIICFTILQIRIKRENSQSVAPFLLDLAVCNSIRHDLIMNKKDKVMNLTLTLLMLIISFITEVLQEVERISCT